MKLELNEATLVNYLAQKGLQWTRGAGQIILAECPYCKSKEKKFSFSAATTAFQCFKASCAQSGNLVTFMRDNGDDPYPTKKAYVLPDQARVRATLPETAKEDNFYSWYGSKEGLGAGWLKKYSVGFKKQEGKLYITFPYFDNGEIVDVKYRNVDKKSDMFTEKSARKIFFGLQYVDFAKDYLLVTEGEKDCIAMAEMGFDNVVSVPNGAKNFSEAMGEVLKRGKFKKIYLFFDSDQAGQDGAKNFALKVGNWRCRNVVLPFKDAQDCLRNWVEPESIQERMDIAKKFDIEDDLENDVAFSQEEIRDLYDADCKLNQYGVMFGIPLLDAVTGGLFPGQLMGIIAGPGGFKTLTTENLLGRAVDSLADDEIASFFSMEMSLQREFQRRMQIEYGYSRSFLRRGSKDAEPWYISKADNLVAKHSKLYVSGRSNLTVDQMARIICNTQDRTGKKVRLVAIDYLDYIDSKDKKGFNPVGEVMKDLNKKLAKPLGVSVVILVQTNRAHLTEGDYGVSLGDGKGGRSIEQELDFYFGLFQDKEKKENRGNWLKHRDFEPDPLLFPGIYPFPYFRLKMNKIKLLDMELISEAELRQEKDEKKNRKKTKQDEEEWGK
jgi:5S rRNA maturation endonuclease (ribonuclease M5)